MSTTRLLIALLFVFVGLSVLNYVYYDQRLSHIEAAVKSDYGGNLIDQALDKVGVITARMREAQHEHDNFVDREIILAIAAGVGMILLYRAPKQGAVT